MKVTLHCIELHSRMHFPTTTIVLPLKWGKFKLAKQQLSSIHP